MRTHGTKPKPICGTDLGTNFEKDVRQAEGDMEEGGEKGTCRHKINLMGHSCSRGQEPGQVEATNFWPYPPPGGKELNLC